MLLGLGLMFVKYYKCIQSCNLESVKYVFNQHPNLIIVLCPLCGSVLIEWGGEFEDGNGTKITYGVEK